MDIKAASTAEYYHEMTKYRPETIGSHPGMDWDKKPSVFKNYAGAERVDLFKRLPVENGRLVNFDFNVDADAVRPSLDAISRILFFTNGVTGVAQAPGEYHYYRAAPSAGALYPTEVYIAVRNHPELPSGIYNLSIRDHELQRISPPGFGPEGDELFERLSAAALGHPAIEASDVCLIFSAIFNRSSWRYGQRAYRRCMLDTGHVIGNFNAYLPTEKLSTYAISGFVDSEMNELLGLEQQGQSGTPGEGVCALYPILGREAYARVFAEFPQSALRSSPLTGTVRADEPKLLATLVEATSIRRKDAALARPSGASLNDQSARSSPFRFAPGMTFSATPPSMLEDIMPVILSRRSTRAFSGGSLTVDDLRAVLEYAYRYDLAQPDATLGPRLFAPSLLESWIVVQNVEGIKPGVYFYSPRERQLSLVDAGDFRKETYFLTLQQELAPTAAALLIHTADLPAAVDLLGNRAYRTLHMDAGHIGERVNLACIAHKLGVSGIGGFFDEEVNALLAIPQRQACVYITCIGQPARE